MKVTIQEAMSLLKSGRNVALPTETVYGLAAALIHTHAIENIYVLKGRPSSNPLIIHVETIDQIKEYVTVFPPHFSDLAQAFWPGPLTLILPIYSESIPTIVRAGLPTAGFRIPHDPLTLKVIKEVGPIVMPSANLSGRPSATTPEHVEEDFGKEFPVLDGGACARGLESTILYYQENKWVILRLGSISAESFKSMLGYQPSIAEVSTNEKPLCPGQLFRHYSPKAQLISGRSIPDDATTIILGFYERVYPVEKRVIYLGSLQDPSTVAESLYGVLRQLDQEKIHQAWVDMDFPCNGLWNTIAERLQRASTSCSSLN